MLDAVRRDIRFAVRSFVKAPVFATAIVATIALAVGATASIFAVVNGILLRPLPFPNSERAVRFCETNPSIGEEFCGASPMNVADWARATSLLESAGVARREDVRGRDGNGNYPVPAGIASPGFFHTLGMRLVAGRLISDADMARGGNRVALVSYDFWQKRLGGNRAAVGRTLVLDGEGYTVVGVLAQRTYLPNGELSEVELWRPLTASFDDVEDRNWRGFTAVGLAAPGVSKDALFAQLSTIRLQLAKAYPEPNKDWGLRVVGLRESLVGNTRPTLVVFLGAVGFVLLIACANVASLLMVRATGRGLEFAVRSSLGAGRGRLVQQLVTESLVLALAGGGLGLLLASWVTSAFVAVAPPTLPRLEEVSVDGRVAAFALLVAACTALLFGFAPARSAARADLNGILKGARTTGTGHTWLRPAFVVAQLSLALVLLFGAGLLTRSFSRMTNWQPGFDRAGLVTTWLSSGQKDVGAAVSVMARAREEVASVPGVRSAALASAGPLFGGEETGTLAVEGRPFSAKDAPTVQWFDVSPEFFQTLGVRVVRGRSFGRADDRNAAPVAIVNETLVRRFFPHENPIGRRVTVTDHPSEIVGVVADVKPLRGDRPTMPQVFWPIEQYRRLGAMLLVRTVPGVAGIEKAVRARVAGVNADLQLSTFRDYDDTVDRQLVSPRFNMLLIASFALVALLLAGLGVYGVMAYSVASRTREFGVRIALGASSGTVVRSVVGHGMALVGVATLVGSAGALMLGRLLRTLLYGLPVRDPLTLTAAAGLLGLVALLACYLPARRASRVDPISALRAE